MSFARYPSYKDSGVDWLGEVPEHWSVQPFKHQIARNDGGVWGDDPDGIDDTFVLRSTEQTVDGHWKLDDPATRKLNESEISSSLLAENDLLLTKSSGSSLHIGKTTLVMAEIAALRCCYSNFMQRIRMEPTFLPRLAWHVMNNALARLQFDLLSNSSTGLANLNATMVGQIVVPVAPLLEQTQIAAFLDRETAKIDALVAEQRRLMALLKEKRQALISHAVTRGLNPDAPMKPSGIEGTENVPANWDVLVIKRFSTLHRGHDLTDAERTEGSYPVVTSSGINGTHGSFMANGPGVVTGRYGSTGRLFYISDDFWPHNTSLYVSNFHGNDVRFVWYSLQTVDFAAHSAKAAVPGIDRNDIHVLPVAVPPKDEQVAIVTFLDSELTKLDLLTTENQRVIDLLQERRTALISAAVTGQIDVRELA